MSRSWMTILAAILLFPAILPAQLVDPSSLGALCPQELSCAAYATYINSLRANEPETDAGIQSKYWAEPIKALKPIKVYTHRSNLVVVLGIFDEMEEGKYFYLSPSPSLPRNGIDGFEFTPTPQSPEVHEILDYKRVKGNPQTTEPEDLPSKLRRIVQNYSLSARNILEALTRIAGDFKIPMGIEWVISAEAKNAVVQSGKSVTVEQIIKRIVGTQPGYEVQTRDGVLHICSPGLIPDRQNFLKVRLDNFTVYNEPLEVASAWELHNLINDVVFPPKPGPHGRGGSIASSSYEPLISLETSNAAVEDILDRLLLKSARRIWIVTFADSSATTHTGFRRTLSLWTDLPGLDENQPVWDWLHWDEDLPTALLGKK